MADFTVMVKGIPAATEKPGGLAGRMADVKVWLEKLVEELAQADGEKGGSVVEMTAGLAQAPRARSAWHVTQRLVGAGTCDDLTRVVAGGCAVLKAYIERAKLYRDSPRQSPLRPRASSRFVGVRGSLNGIRGCVRRFAEAGGQAQEETDGRYQEECGREAGDVQASRRADR